MRTAWLLAIGLAFLAGHPSPALAQDSPKTGIVIGYPLSLGVIWHASPAVAIRPEFTYTGVSSETVNPSFTSNTSGWATGIGLSVLFYTRTEEHFRTYIVPRFSYTHTSSTHEVDSPPAIEPSLTTSSNVIGGSGSFGAQYQPARRFAVFGEVGFEVDHATSKPSITGTKGTSTNWGTRAGVGVIFYP
jgi:hypothetical protein